MAFLQRGRGDRREQRLFNEGELIWGVPRKPGYDDQDDPKAHAGVTQHAFEPGNDERAICGFEPPKRAGGTSSKPRPQLALPTARLNPRCPKCMRLIEVPEPPAAAEPPAPEPPAPKPQAQPKPPDAVEPEPTMAAEPEPAPEPAAEPEPVADVPPDPPTLELVNPEPVMQPVKETRPRSAEPPLVAPARSQVPPPPAPPPIRSAPPKPARSVTPAIQRDESWEGTADFSVGQISVVVRPPTKPGLGVVASVVAGPSGTRVASVQMNGDGTALISLADAARAPVTVAWFVVPMVDREA
jgi:hypothetical protein